MPAAVLTLASDLDGLGAWYPSGGAADLLDGIQSNDTKYASFSAGVNESHILRAGFEAPASLPASFDVTLRHVRTVGFAVVTELRLQDASGTTLFTLSPNWTVPSVETDDLFSLTQVFGGVPDTSGDWVLELRYYTDPVGGGGANLDQVSATYDGSGAGGGGGGPGGQNGVNGSFFLGLCGF